MRQGKFYPEKTFFLKKISPCPAGKREFSPFRKGLQKVLHVPLIFSQSLPEFFQGKGPHFVTDLQNKRRMGDLHIFPGKEKRSQRDEFSKELRKGFMVVENPFFIPDDLMEMTAIDKRAAKSKPVCYRIKRGKGSIVPYRAGNKRHNVKDMKK